MSLASFDTIYNKIKSLISFHITNPNIDNISSIGGIINTKDYDDCLKELFNFCINNKNIVNETVTFLAYEFYTQIKIFKYVLELAKNTNVEEQYITFNNINNKKLNYILYNLVPLLNLTVNNEIFNRNEITDVFMIHQDKMEELNNMELYELIENNNKLNKTIYNLALDKSILANNDAFLYSLQKINYINKLIEIKKQLNL
jgi:hypothetical protein